MKGVVTDLVAGPHVEDGLACRLKRGLMEVAVRRPAAFPGRRLRGGERQMRRELLAHGLGHRGGVLRKKVQRAAQGAVASPAELAADGIVVMEIEDAQKWLERQSLQIGRAHV